ncbi:MAG: O-antigen ligase family protein [Acidobacteriota bacterium]
MNTPASEAASNIKVQGRAGTVAYWLTISLIVAVPCAFSTAVHRMYSLPKFALLVTGAAALLPLLLWIASCSRQRGESRKLLASRHVLLVSLFLIVISVSTFLGASPIAELFGSSYNQMGLITYICFFVVFATLIVVIGKSEKRFRWTLWAMTLTGLAIATYGYVQFFGRDPFVPSRLYTFESAGGPVLRIIGTLGHSNYLGNFLLYVAPLAAGLGLNSRGSARRVGLATAILSAAAIVFSGTRGAWLGLVAGLLTFVLLARSWSKGASLFKRRAAVRWAVPTFIVILFFSALIAINPASRNIVQRAGLLVNEKTGSGRTLLWRDSMKMLAQNPLVGCGPEGFRKAFLPYKSIELGRLAPGTNNESSHSSYIDAALSYGLIGAVLYVAVIASSFKMLMRARKRAKDAGSRTITVSMISSMAAVVVHNLFIFDQISTGLYFFVFAALAQSSSHLVTSGTAGETERTGAPVSAEAGLDVTHRRIFALRPGALFTGAACALFVAAAWYSISIVRADVEINKTIAAATTGDMSEVLRHGNRAISYPDPSDDYRFLFARALALCGDNLPIADPVAGAESDEKRGQTSAERKLAFTLAISHAEASLTRTLTPDANYVLLAYLALRLGDREKLFGYASKAVEAGPNFSNAHWLLAEAHLARGEHELAAREAQLALNVNPNSGEARSAFKRARSIPDATDDPEELIAYAKTLARDGKSNKARRILLRAIDKSGGPCPNCHAALAVLYEEASLYGKAIAEWEAYAREAPERASEEKTILRIERLQREAASKR